MANVACPVCGETTLEEIDAYEICDVCNWEDDPAQRANPLLRGGANTQCFLEALVAHSFRLREYPREPLCTTTNDEGTTELFQGTAWKDHQLPELAIHTFALNIFTPEALCYFLPAFICAGVQPGGDGVRDSTLLRVTPPKGDRNRPSFQAWWSLLSDEEQRAVQAFVDRAQ